MTTPALGDTHLSEAAQRGLAELFEKASPLLQGKRFDNIVDLLSLVSDGVDIMDAGMVEKLIGAFDDAVGGAWLLGNAARYAANEASLQPPPSLRRLFKLARQDDVRRGLQFSLLFFTALGRQMRTDPEE